MKQNGWRFLERLSFRSLLGLKARQSGRRKTRQRAWWKEVKWQMIGIVVIAVLLSGLVFSGVLLLDSSNSQDHLHQAKQFMEEGKVAWAAKDLEALIEEHPDLYEAWIYLGQCYLELNELDKAENAFESAMAIRTKHKGFQYNTQDVLTLLAESKLLRLQHRYKEAENLLIKAYEKHPANIDLKHALWDVYYQWGLWLLNQNTDPLKALEVLENAQSFVTRYRYDIKLQEAIEEAVNRQYLHLQETGASLKARRVFLKHALSKHYSHVVLANLAQVEADDHHTQASLLYLKQAYTLMPHLYALRYSQSLEDNLKLAITEGHQRRARALMASLERIQHQIKEHKNQLPYAVTASIASLALKALNPKTGEWSPNISVRLQNRGSSEIPFTKVKLRLFSGKHTLDLHYESLKTPLSASKSVGSTQIIHLSDEHHYMVQRLTEGRLSLEVFIAFDESKEAQWYPMALFHKTVVNPKKFKGQTFPWEGASKPKTSVKQASTLPTNTI